MKLYRTKGIVLKSIKLGEADKIVTIFSPVYGKIRGVAKGIRKTKSKFGSRLEPFTYVDLLVYQGRELDIITQAEIIDSFKEIRADLEKLKYGSIMLELVDRVAQEKEEAEEIFLLFLSALKSLREAEKRLSLLLSIFEFKLMSTAGYHPHVENCVICGQEKIEKLHFSFKYGGFLCGSCKGRDEEAIILSAEGGRLLNRIFSISLKRWTELKVSSQSEKELFRLAQLYVTYYLEKHLKSPRLLNL